MNLSEQQRETCKVIDAEYTVESDGHRLPQPVVHLFCRDEDRNRRRIEVEGFRPYFMISFQEFIERTRDVINDRHVIAVEADLDGFAHQADMDASEFDSPGDVAKYLTDSGNARVYHKPDSFDSLDGNRLVKIYTVEPGHVGKIRDHFDRTWEADVPFTRRFLISSGIHHGIEIPDGATTVRYENWDGHSESSGQIREISPSDPPEIEPRMLVVDIEVATHGGGVPDPADAYNEITAITAYDNYTGEYAGWILESDEWETVPDEDEFESNINERLDMDIDAMSVYDHEASMVESFHNWVIERDFDLVTGWNSSSFDYPYIIQRSYNISAYSIRDWDVFGSPFNAGDEWPDPVIEGRVTFDMMEAYKKTQFRELRSYSLEYVAQEELGMGKEELGEELDDAWHYHPIDFMVYNVRDVQAVVEIERTSALLKLYDNMRQVTGALYNTCHHNGPMLDTLFLRQAYDEGIALTTNYAPDQGDYAGAKVFDPVPGVHENVVYPDLASLYPYILWTLNISPETLYMDKEEYRKDGFEDDQMFSAYIDTREWKVMSSGETVEPSKIDKDRYKGVHDETGSRKKKTSQGFDGIFDPLQEEHPKSKTKVFFVKPDVEEGFIRKTVDLLVDLKYRYKGQGDMYAAVKRVTNSIYGVLGDSASGGKGFRLFDWRLAEAITNTGRMVIEFTADEYVRLINEYAEEAGYEPNTYLVGGDSVPAHEPTIIRRDGSVDIVPIEDVSIGDEVWSDAGWTCVKDVIKKPNRKEMYTVQTKNGIAHVTEDHGLLDENGIEQTPDDTEVGDELLHEDIALIDHDEASFTEERAWLLGLFAAEGSCGIYECQSGSKASWAINNTDRSVLEHAQSVMDDVFGIDTKIDDVRESSNTMKLRLHETGDNPSVVLGFREMLYDGTEKRVPREILNADDTAQTAFLAGYHTGDGHIAHDHKEFDEMWTKHRLLASGITYLLRQQGHNVSLNVRTEQKTEYYRIRSVGFHVGSATEVRSIEQTEYDGDYVYDLETENHHFHSGMGSMIVHNTDSVMSSIPSAPDYQTALDWAQRASVQVSGDLYDEFMEDEFNVIQGRDEHKMDVEIESLASNLFFTRDWDKDYEVAVKKRYAQHEIWDEDDGWLHDDLRDRSNVSLDDYRDDGILSASEATDDIDITGFEYVRSDTATVTKNAQLQILTYMLLSDNMADDIYTYLSQYVEDIKDGSVPADHLGRPKGISNELDEYGWKTYEELQEDTNYTATEEDEQNGGRYVSTPSPTYRGAKYADDHFDWEDISAGSKPVRFYIDKVRGDTYPPAYEYDTYPNDDRPDPPEVGRSVDAIAVDDTDRIPDGFILDREKMIDKELKDKLEPILRTIGEEWDGIVGNGRQVGLDQWQ